MTACGREAPLAHGVDGALIEPGTQALEHFYAADTAVAPYHDLEHDIPFDAFPPRVFGVLGLDLAQQARRRDSAARPIRSAAGAPSGAGTDAGTVPFANSRPLARPRAAARSRALAACVGR